MSDNAPRFGFVNFAETWNGRLAMLGFVIGLGTELLTGAQSDDETKHGETDWAPSFLPVKAS